MIIWTFTHFIKVLCSMFDLPSHSLFTVSNDSVGWAHRFQLLPVSCSGKTAALGDHASSGLFLVRLKSLNGFLMPRVESGIGLKSPVMRNDCPSLPSRPDVSSLDCAWPPCAVTAGAPASRSSQQLARGTHLRLASESRRTAASGRFLDACITLVDCHIVRDRAFLCARQYSSPMYRFCK